MLLDSALHRRELLRLGALAGLVLPFAPGLAFAAADRPNLLPNVTSLIERWVGPGKFPGMVAALGLPGREAQYVTRGNEGFTDADENSAGTDPTLRAVGRTAGRTVRRADDA